MDLELFTVLYKQNGAIGIEFNEQLLQAATEEEIFKEMTNEMKAIKPIVSKLMIFLQKRTEPKVPETCYEAYGKDLDACSTQESEGCGRCSLFK